MKTLKNLADYALEVYNEKFIYAWGTSGQRLRDVYTRLKTSDYYKKNSDSFKNITDIYNSGKNPQVCDCHGIAEACLMEVGDECPYNSSLDSTADNDFNYVRSHGTKGVDWGDISSINKTVEGLGLHKNGHFGVSMGDGTAIDIYRTGYPARRSPIENVPWLHWFTPKGFVRTPSTTVVATPTPIVPAVTVQPSFIVKRVIKFGDSGADVLAIEIALEKQGYKCNITNKEKTSGIGKYGLTMKIAVGNFQKKHPECGTNKKPDYKIGKNSVILLGGKWEG